jgi:HK97 gp10 family phage protein
MGFDFQMRNDRTKEVKEQVADRALVALDAVGMQASSLAKMELQKSPMRVDTGLLRNSITHAVAGKPAAIGGYSADTTKNGRENSGSYAGTAPAPDNPEQPFVLVGTNVEYALYVHEGTSHMEPNRFLKNALMNNRAELEKIIQNVLSQ